MQFQINFFFDLFCSRSLNELEFLFSLVFSSRRNNSFQAFTNNPSKSFSSSQIEYLGVLSLFLDMSETSDIQHDERFHDESDFYDFLEAISDKIDSIGRKSMLQNNSIFYLNKRNQNLFKFQLTRKKKILETDGDEQKKRLKNKGIF